MSDGSRHIMPPSTQRFLMPSRWMALALGSGLGLAASPELQFNRDIRPVLADNCFHCHGPDPGTRKAGLRLDTEAGFFAKRQTKDGKEETFFLAQNPLSQDFHSSLCSGQMEITVTGTAKGPVGEREIVATKAICQMFGHLAKLFYFGAIIDQAASLDPIVAALAIAASMVGTTLATRVLHAMTDKQFRAWANGIITVIAGYYIVHGAYLLVAS